MPVAAKRRRNPLPGNGDRSYHATDSAASAPIYNTQTRYLNDHEYAPFTCAVLYSPPQCYLNAKKRPLLLTQVRMYSRHDYKKYYR
jgi:hypothetical protein